jgi:hypothetical protein
MDAERLGRYKGVSQMNANLRDYMTDLELARASVAETTAATRHRNHGSNGFEALNHDVKAAGRIVSRTRRRIEAMQN